MINKLPLSIALISYNEEKNLKRTLEAVIDIASEIIIIDSFSTDNTKNIAREFGALVYQEKWLGYSKQKNLLIEKCSYDWILFLDCDEVLSDELKNSIIKVITENSQKNSGYYINRKTVYLGKKLNYAWHPDWVLRLVNKNNNPRWKEVKVHEHLIIEGNTKKLTGYLFHFSYKGIDDHFIKTIRYAKLSAEDYYERGKKFTFFKLIFNPLISFIKQLIIKKAILDGIPGIIASISAFVYTFLKYAFLWDICRKD